MVVGQHSCCNKQKVKRGLWSPEEDEKLVNYISTFGHGCWSSVPKLAGLQRCGKSCRLRWINYLRPDLKRGTFSSNEARLIIQLHKILGNRWAQIAKHLPGRTDNEVKNFWNSSIKKKLLQSSANQQFPADPFFNINDNLFVNYGHGDAFFNQDQPNPNFNMLQNPHHYPMANQNGNPNFMNNNNNNNPLALPIPVGVPLSAQNQAPPVLDHQQATWTSTVYDQMQIHQNLFNSLKQEFYDTTADILVNESQMMQSNGKGKEIIVDYDNNDFIINANARIDSAASVPDFMTSKAYYASYDSMPYDDQMEYIEAFLSSSSSTSPFSYSPFGINKSEA